MRTTLLMPGVIFEELVVAVVVVVVVVESMHEAEHSQ